MTDKLDLSDIFSYDPNFQTVMLNLLQTALDQSFQGVMITEAEPGYPIIYVNPAFSELTGYEPYEVMGKSPSILQGPRTDQAVIDQLEMDLSHGKAFQGRAINYRKDGSEFTMQWKIAPIHNEKNEVTHFLAIQQIVFE